MENEKFLSDFIVTVIEDMETGKRLKFRQSCRVARSYIVNFRSALGWVRRFENERGRRVTLEEVDMIFQREFVGFLVTRGLKPNTVKTRLAVIHTVMREALLRGVSRNDAYQDPDFIPLIEATECVCLTEKQIEEMWEMDLNVVKGKKRVALERVRDVFMMGCMTGQRFSDYTRIERSMVVQSGGYKFLRLTQKKTGMEVMIPVNERIERLLEKYDGVMPEVNMSSFSTYIKVLGEMLGWTWHPDTKSGKLRFCDMLSSHTARRSFVTNAYLRGVPLKSIMTVTGHTSERTLRTYLRLGANEKAMMAIRDFNGFLNIVSAR